MQLSSKSPATRAALLYITIGAIVIVWTLIWIIYLLNHPPHASTTYYVCAGFLSTGIIVLLIGISMGSIGRSARDAETPNIITPPAQPIQPVVPVASSNPVPGSNGMVSSPEAVNVTGVPQATIVVPVSPDTSSNQGRVVAGVEQPQLQR